MEISYRFVDSDLAAYREAVAKRAGYVPRGSGPKLLALLVPLAVAVAAFAAAYAISTVVLGEPLQALGFVFGLVSGLIVAVASLLFARRSALGRIFRPGGPTLSPHRLAVTAEGVRIISPQFETLYRWSAIESMTTEPAILVLWLEPAAGVAVPRSAFGSAAAEQDFMKTINRMLVSARLPRSGAFA